MTAPDVSAATTLGEAWRMLRAAFRAAGLETADLDARLLTAGLTGHAQHLIVTGTNVPLSPAQAQKLAEAMAERLDGRPVHRILGAREFYGLSLVLSPGTLEPRPDTETLVDAAIPFVRSTVAAKGSCRIADLGIGTGAIGLALLAECPEADCLGIDLSAEAVSTALENARSLGLSDRYRAVVGDWFTGIDAQFDLIVSNPPYIPTADLAGLAREVTGHDPALALDGGTDGLTAYRAIAGQAADRLMAGGRVALEIGLGQKDEVAELFADAGFDLQGVIADLGGVDRVLLFDLRDRGTGFRSDF